MKVSGSGGLHVWNKETLNYDNLFCVWVFILGYNLYGVDCPWFIFCIFDAYKQPSLKKVKNNNNTDDGMICGNTLIPVNQKACVPNRQKLPQWTTSTTERINNIPHNRVLGEIFMIRV